MSRRQKKKNKAGRASIACIVICLLAVMSVQVVRLYNKNQEYAAKEAQLNQQLEEETERENEIAAYEQYIGSQDYVEDTAKSKLGLVYDNEMIFKEK
jgi:cell division protein DivIC